MKLLLIVNASASSVTARARVVIQKSLAADHDVTLAETSRQGHATRLAQGAAARGMDAVIVLGGDGTFNEAANGLAGTDTALGVLPGGSTNVFARTIGMTNDPIEATGELLAALGVGLGGIRRVGLGNVNGRRFLFHVGVGFDAAVVSEVERRSALKRYLGHAFFAYSALRTWGFGYDRHHPHFAITLTDSEGSETRVDDGYFAILMNTNPYTFVGDRPFNLAPGTGLDNPLTAVVLRSLGAPTIIGMGLEALRNPGATPPPGRPDPHRRKVTFVRNVVAARLEGLPTVPYQVDGEPLGEATELRFGWEPDSLRLVVPGRQPGS